MQSVLELSQSIGRHCVCGTFRQGANIGIEVIDAAWADIHHVSETASAKYGLSAACQGEFLSPDVHRNLEAGRTSWRIE